MLVTAPSPRIFTSARILSSSRIYDEAAVHMSRQPKLVRAAELSFGKHSEYVSTPSHVLIVPVSILERL